MPDNYRVGASARFRIAVICRGNDVGVSRGEAPRRDNKSLGGPQTETKLRVVTDHDVVAATACSADRDPLAIPEDRIPPIPSDAMQNYIRFRMIHKQTRLKQVQITEPTRGAARDDVGGDDGRRMNETKYKGGDQDMPPPPSYSMAMEMKHKKILNCRRCRVLAAATARLLAPSRLPEDGCSPLACSNRVGRYSC